jgi:hypothetical protein
MPATNLSFRYFMAMTGGDQARIYSTSAVAGRLIAAWRLRIPVSGVIVGIPDNIVIRDFKVPLSTQRLAPIALAAAEANPVMDIVAVQAAAVLAIGKPVVTAGANREILEAFEIADDILRWFGAYRLKLLVRALLSPPYDEAGIQPVPCMADIEARDAPPCSPHIRTGNSLHASDRARIPARIGGKSNGDAR